MNTGANDWDGLETDERDYLTEPPRADPAGLYGLIGDIGRAAANGTEANPYAASAAAMVRLSAAVGPAHYLRIGDVSHRCRLYGLQVGRSGRGGKGEAFALVNRIFESLEPNAVGGEHRGGLSSAEGLAMLLHDGYEQGEIVVAAIEDKRLFVLESELDSMLSRLRQTNNALSAALRDVFDGGSIRPATKSARVFSTQPHIAVWANITPSELHVSMSAKELSNGFANRFLILFAERTGIVPIPRGRTEDEVKAFAARVRDAVEFARGGYPHNTRDTPMRLSPAARSMWDSAYREMRKPAGTEKVNALLERRPPITMRIAMLFALLDRTTEIGENHLAAALAWARFHGDSVRFIFDGDMAQRQRAEAVSGNSAIVMNALTKHGGWVSRTELRAAFNNRVKPGELDAALQALLHDCKIERRDVRRDDGPGKGRTDYRLAQSAQTAQIGQQRASDPNAQSSRSAQMGVDCDDPESANSAESADAKTACDSRQSTESAKSAISAAMIQPAQSRRVDTSPDGSWQ